MVPERAWTSADGRTMKASLISLKDQTGSFKRTDGRTFELALDKLSPADQAVVAEAVKKPRRLLRLNPRINESDAWRLGKPDAWRKAPRFRPSGGLYRRLFSFVRW